MANVPAGMASSLRRRATRLKLELAALALASRDPRVPWYARVVAAGVLVYALSPIDLIPDPIPLLGQLDDLIVIPLGIALAIRLIPPTVLAECRAKAAAARPVGRAGWAGAVFVVVAWLVVVGLAVRYIPRLAGS